MENKDGFIYKLLCMACLCVGRSLNTIKDDKMKKYYLDILNEIPLCNMPTICPSICWECEATLKRVIAFREQVKDSHRILQTYTNENLYECLLTDVSRPSRLKAHVLPVVNILPNNDDIGTNKQTDEKLCVKDEVTLEIDPFPYNESDCSESTMKTERDIKKIKNKNIKNKGIKKRKESKKIKGIRESQNLSNTLENDVNTNSDNSKELMTVSLDYNTMNDEQDRPKDLQLVYVKDELGMDIDVKNRDDETWSNSECSDSNSEIGKCEQRIAMKLEKSNIKCLKKRKKTKEEVNKLKKGRKTKKSEELKILTIELSSEEMFLERQTLANSESFLKAPYKCETCLVSFIYQKSYKEHIVAKHSVDLGDYSCPICKTVVASVDSFSNHYKRHMRRYECGICNKRTMDMRVMQQHYYSVHEISLKEYKCSICGKISKSLDTHRYHKDTHKPRVQCSQCDKTFMHRAGLINHRITVHESHNKFPCSVCSKVFRWKTSLNRHLKEHDVKNKELSSVAAHCATCDVNFASICSYQRHLKNSLKHVTPDQLRFICDHCNRRFADKTKLRDHIEEKHLHKKYQCHICHKPSKSRVGLDQHIRNVHKGRPNNRMCHHCGRGFPTKMQLESHIRTHTGERPFICEYCPTTFSQQSNLYKHNRQVHSNLKTKQQLTRKGKKEDVATIQDALRNDTFNRPVLHYPSDRPFIM